MSKRQQEPRQLGDLEAAIMSVVWQQGSATVEAVRSALEPGRSPAYTTVMTVMSRLAEKGVLERHKEGRAYVYRPAAEQDTVAGSMLSALVSKVYGGSSGRAIAHLIESDEDVADEELARLEELIRAKRKASGR